MGANVTADLAGGGMYGSLERPVEFGSGSTGAGAHGGGAIRLVVGELVMAQGSVISADGEVGASGGSVWVEAGSVARAEGTLSAVGGGAGSVGYSESVDGKTHVFQAGAGGRVSVSFGGGGLG